MAGSVWSDEDSLRGVVLWRFGEPELTAPPLSWVIKYSAGGKDPVREAFLVSKNPWFMAAVIDGFDEDYVYTLYGWFRRYEGESAFGLMRVLWREVSANNVVHGVRRSMADNLATKMIANRMKQATHISSVMMIDDVLRLTKEQ